MYIFHVTCLYLDQIWFLSSVYTRGHCLRLFIAHVNSNVVKYAFFHRTAMLWNTLDD